MRQNRTFPRGQLLTKADLAATAVVANSNGVRVSILCRIIERE